MLVEALRYADFGWRVLPVHGIVQGHCTCSAGARCTSPGKHPAISDWTNAATTDSELIKQWWGKNHNYNIGIASGEASRIFVLDIDPKNGGLDSFSALVQAHGLIETLSATTGSGGKHYIFRQIPGLGNRTSLLPGIDIRGNGGQFVVAPSLHYSGGHYAWDHPRKPIQTAPMWLINLLAPPAPTAHPTGAPLEKWRKLWCEGAESGNRNVATSKLAGYLFRSRLDPLMVFDMMKMWNIERLRPPLSDEELFTIVNSVAGREVKRLR